MKGAPIQKQLLRKLLLHGGSKQRLWAALAAVFTGNLLLLLSVLVWWNFRELLAGKGQNDSLGSTFIIIGKKVTNDNMGKPAATIFTTDDIKDIQNAPQVQSAGVISSNHFPVYATMGGNLSFATDLPLEAVPDSFLDKVPDGWAWKEGDINLPVIVSNQFLDIYNYVFAPSQGLPQLSQSSVKSVGISLKIGNREHEETVIAHVTGFSDRINSVMAPQSFIDYGNNKYGIPGTVAAPSRLILKTNDPSDIRFTNYIEKHNYTTNSQNLRWSKMRAIVSVVAGATGALAVMLLFIGALVFVLFIELTIVRAQAAITLLIELGYSSRLLGRFLLSRFLPLLGLSLFISAIVIIAVQLLAAIAAKGQGLVLPSVPGLPVWEALLVAGGILFVLVSRAVGSAIHKPGNGG